MAGTWTAFGQVYLHNTYRSVGSDREQGAWASPDVPGRFFQAGDKWSISPDLSPDNGGPR
eukprot:7712880-Pyramimonas_sp.AAC.1